MRRPLALAAALVHLTLILSLQADAAIVRQERREAARHLGAGAAATGSWWVARYDAVGTRFTVISDWVAAAGQDTPPPAGVESHPGEGEVLASDGLRRLLAEGGRHGELLGSFLDGEVVGELGDGLLVRPGELVAVVGRDPATTETPPSAGAEAPAPYPTSTPPRAGFAVFWTLLTAVAAVCAAASARLSRPAVDLRRRRGGRLARLRGSEWPLTPGLMMVSATAAWATALIAQPLVHAGSLIGLPVFPWDVTLDPPRLIAAFVLPQAVVAAAVSLGRPRRGLPAAYDSGWPRLPSIALLAAAPVLLIVAATTASLPAAVAVGLQLAAMLALLLAGAGGLTAAVRTSASWAVKGAAHGGSALTASRAVRRNAPRIAAAGLGCAACMVTLGVLLAVEPDASTLTEPFGRVHLVIETPGADAEHLTWSIAGLPRVARVGSYGAAVPPSEGPSALVVTCATAIGWLGIDAASCKADQYRDGPQPPSAADARLMLFGLEGPFEVAAQRVQERAEEATARGWPLLTVDEQTLAQLGARSLVVRTDRSPEAMASVSAAVSRTVPTAALSMPSAGTDAPGTTSARRGAVLAAALAAFVTALALAAVGSAAAHRDLPVVRTLSALGITVEQTRGARALQAVLSIAAVTLPPLVLGGLLGVAIRTFTEPPGAAAAAVGIAGISVVAAAASLRSATPVRRLGTAAEARQPGRGAAPAPPPSTPSTPSTQARSRVDH